MTGQLRDSARTVVVTRVVRPGRYEEFVEWADAVDRHARPTPHDRPS